MKKVDDIEDINLRHIARMENAIEQYNCELLDLQTLIGELEFLRDAVDCFPLEFFIPLNNAIMDMESVNCCFIEGKSFPGIDLVLKESIKKCCHWVKIAQRTIEST